MQLDYLSVKITLKNRIMKFKAILCLALILGLASCKKCYDCTKKCGTCTNGPAVLAGCTGDENLNGASVDSWKLLLETQGFTCQFNNVSEEACGKEEKTNKEKGFFECVSN
jgi:hypothetical protein